MVVLVDGSDVSGLPQLVHLDRAGQRLVRADLLRLWSRRERGL